MLQLYTITTPKQDNGQWGTPLYLTNINGGLLTAGEENQELLSAVLIAFAEVKKCNISLEVTPNIFTIRTDVNNYNYTYKNWGLDGDKLYYISNPEDRKEFDRMMKLKKLTNKK